MVNYGFVFTNRTCIGCHASPVACKSEHDISNAVNRTQVKYIEPGDYPNTKRIRWRGGGVHQNITHTVQSDSISGAYYCRGIGYLGRDSKEEYGEVGVDMNKSMAHYEKWNEWGGQWKTQPSGEGRLLWFKRPLAPRPEHFILQRRRKRLIFNQIVNFVGTRG